MPDLASTRAVSGVQDLVDRMRRGDRDAAATFLEAYGNRIRRRIRGKLSLSMRRIFDSQDILSTIGRKLDLYVRDGRIDATNPDELWSLVMRMAKCAVISKVRVFQRLQQAEQADGQFARELLRRFEDAERRAPDGAEIEIDQALKLLGDRTDRQVLSMWLMGSALNEIASHLGMAATAVRKRWQNIKAQLQAEFAPGVAR